MMSNHSLLFSGTIIGFLIAAPVGPIGVLCIQRTLFKGRAVGLITGLGAATADAFYGFIAGFGLTLLSSILTDQQWFLRLAGGIFLCYLGFKIFFSKPAEQLVSTERTGLAGAYASAFFLTLANPMTILSFSAIFTGFGAVGSYSSAMTMVSGIFVGSGIWWLILSGSVSLFRTRFNARMLKWVNRISGLMIIGFGLFVFANVIR